MIMINYYGVDDERQLMTSDLHLFVDRIVELVSNAGDKVLRNFILPSTVVIKPAGRQFMTIK